MTFQYTNLSTIAQCLLLKDVVNIRSGKTPSRSNAELWGDFLPWVSAKDLKTFYINDSIEHLSHKAVDEGVPVANVGDILVLVRGMTLFKDIPIALVTRPVSFNQDVKAISVKKGIECEYLAYALVASRPKLMPMIDSAGHGTGRLDTDRLLSLPIWIPNSCIQKKIINIFKSFTTIENNLKQLIEAKRSLKQGLMQQLLTGKRRFPEFEKSRQKQDAPIGYIPKDWQLVTIGEIAKEISEKGAPEGTTVLSCTKHNGLVSSLEYFGRQIFSQNLDTYKVVKGKQFAYATNHIEEGSIGLLRDLDVGLVSPMYTVFETSDKVETEFLFAILKTESYRRIFESLTSASVNRRGSLRWNVFSKIIIGLPSLLEQQKIVSVLLTLDQEILLLEKQLNLLKLQKRGLMQKLLTGEIQVPISHENVA